MVLYLPASAAIIFNIVTFPAFIFLSVVLLYLGRSTNPEKRITLPWIFMSLGVFLMGVPYLLEIAVFYEKITEITVFAPSYFFILVGAMMTFTSFAALYSQRVNDINSLKKREKELRLIMRGLKERYLKRELSETDLRKMYPDFIKELTEIEVRLKEMERKSSI